MYNVFLHSEPPTATKKFYAYFQTLLLLFLFTCCAYDNNNDDEGRINFSVPLSPKTTRTRNNWHRL